MSGLIVNHNDVHVWTLRLSENKAKPEEFYDSLLTQDEIDRADKLRFEEHRQRFKIARGNLRLLLSKYLNKKPRQLWIRYGKYGKPFLSDESNPDRINFNLSHSKDTVLYALTKEREIGIDIEHHRDVSRSDKIIQRFFSEEEIAYYNSAEKKSKQKRFFKLWCEREAYSKAIGSGVYMPREKINLSFLSGEQFPGNEDKKRGSDIRIHKLEADEGYTAYLAVSGTEHKITQRDIESSE